MAYYEDVWDKINCARTTATRDSSSFRGLPLSAQIEVNDIIEDELKTRAKQYAARAGLTLDSYAEVKARAERFFPVVVNNFKTSTPLTKSFRDAMSYRGGNTPSMRGGIANNRTMNGVYGQDPNTATYSIPNIWISPYEAATIYSQKGIPEAIINKKSKSILLNGGKVKNPRLTPEQLDKVQEDMTRNGFMNKVVEAVANGLTYGGALVFPMYKTDNPMTMDLPISTLARYGVIGKGKIDRFVVLDRWNTVHIPAWDPTAADFQYPRRYYIPFLGTNVSGTRCGRIVTAPQPGYYGVLLTMGWGISDIPGWIEAVLNYYSVMAAIPTMINQMSIIVRQFDVEGPMATEGMNVLDDIDYEGTIRIREASMNNPINMDIVGNIQAIQRDFKEVPALVRLLRQDVGGRANIAEELLWSSERGAFSSGDDTEGALEKLWENNKYIHKDVAQQLRNVVQLEVINALGLDRNVLAALPYTTIEFDNPSLTDAYRKSEFFANMAKAAFDLSGARVPMDQVTRIASAIGDTDFPVDSDLMSELQTLQGKLDKQADAKFDKEQELLDAQIALTREQTKHVGDAPAGGVSGGSVKPKKPDGDKAKGHSYSDRLEQHRHEKTRGTMARRVGLARAGVS